MLWMFWAYLATVILTLHFVLASSCPSGHVDKGEYVAGGAKDCVECPSKCTSCAIKNGDVICTECSEAHYLSNELECLPCYSDCSICTGETISECLLPVSGKGYDAVERVISECAEGCEYCPDATSEECYSSCKAGYYISSTFKDSSIECSQCPANCTSCFFSYEVDMVVCSQCDETFALDIETESKECTEECGSVCFECNGSTGECQVCNSGYELDDETCKEFSESSSSDSDSSVDECTTLNCEICEDYTCDECKLGYSFPYNSERALEKSVRLLSLRSLQEDNTDLENYFYYWYYNYYSGATYSSGDNWQEAGYDYSTCTSCEEIGPGCIECDFRMGICLSCELGRVWDSVSEECVDCDLEGCLVCETHGICQECVPGYYWDGVKEKCIVCHDSCGLCIGPTESECTACPITRWAYWHPYEITGAEGADGFLNRAPGPWSTGFVKYGLTCATQCSETSEEDHEIQFFNALRTCWVEISESDLMDQNTVGPYAISQRDANDLSYLAVKFFQIFESVASNSAEIELSDSSIYMLKKNWEGLIDPEDECYENGIIDYNIDPLARVAEYCDCNDADLELAFYGPACQQFLSLKLSAESEIFGAIHDTVISWPVGTSHTETVQLIIALIYAQRSKTLHIDEVGEASDKIVELIEYVDISLYPFIYEDILVMTGSLAEVFGYHFITQLSMPDKSYSWDEETDARRLVMNPEPNPRKPKRVLVGSTTQVSMKNSLASFLTLVAEALSNSTPNGYLAESTTGLSYGFFEVAETTKYFEAILETNNLLGRGAEYEKDEESYSAGIEVFETVLNITHSTSEFAGNYLYMASVDQFLGSYLTSETMSVTNLVYFGIKSGFGAVKEEKYSAGDVEVHLVPTTSLDSSLTISCGVFFPETGVLNSTICEMETSENDKTVCFCNAKYTSGGWVVGWVDKEAVKELIDAMSEEGIYEVSFGARIMIIAWGLVVLIGVW